jgi:TonB-linked SusC/RagA family outer membrane protein
MRKFTIFLAFLLFCGLQVTIAQTRITGNVTSADDGLGIPGVSVIVKGTTLGTITDVDGKYSLSVPEGSEALIFSFVGMLTQEIAIGDKVVINVQLKSSTEQLDEYVVTALGVSREKKALGYAVQDVKANELLKGRENTVAGALAGKVSGLQISSNSGQLGGSSRILIRGASSVNGNNQPLYVVDGIAIDNSNFTDADQERGAGGYDYGSMANDINPDDIESVSVLKGPVAAALYGSRAANGVILITTKKGKVRAVSGKKGIGVSANFGVMFDKVAMLPDFQNSYAGGFGWDTLWYSDHSADPTAFPNRNAGYYPGTHNGAADSYDLLMQYEVDESWGPKMDEGVMYRPWYSFQDAIPGYFGKNVPLTSQPDNIKDFFKTGQTWTSNIALTGGSEQAYFRLSFTNVDQNGVMPKSNLKKNSINFSGSAKIGEKLTAFTNINYIKTAATGRPMTGYEGDNIMQQFNQWSQRQMNMDMLHDYWINPDGTTNTWNRSAWNNPFPKYTDNPYWTRYRNYENDGRDRFYGNVGFTYEFFEFLKLTAKVNQDYYTDRREERIAIGSNNTPSYKQGIRTLSERNAEFLFEFNKRFSDDFSLSANFGGNQMTRIYHRDVSETQGGLSLPDFYNLINSKDAPLIGQFRDKKRINSLYGFTSLGYKNMYYLDLTLRSDWSSTLPEDNNQYLYPSATASWVFSELDAINDIDWLSFAKLRVGWAQVGSDTDPYQLYDIYRAKESFGSSPVYTVPNKLFNDQLKPERTNSWEIGTDIRFFDGRLGLDLTYYNMETVDQIIDVDISGTSGFSSKMINAGKITNKGVEVLLTGTPVKTSDFRWDITVNWAKNKNEVVELAEGITNYRLANAPFAVSVNATVGEPYGNIMGRNYLFADDGQRIVGASGRYDRTTDTEPLGNVMPDWTGGVNNSFTYKNINLSFLIDIRKGGQFFSTSYMWGMYSGMIEKTVENNIREDGIVLDGVMEDPNNPGQYITNTIVCDVNNYGLAHYYVHAMDVFDADYIKLRELTLGYTLPNSMLKKVPFSNIRISFVARNLFTWGTAVKGIDPDFATNAGNTQGIEGAQVPSIKSFGFNLSFNL